ncbi:hypothetical protein TURU_018406 [Turdus rufiventris]|nr:hypothetical protein TURU_018406 [Turdus rufiventris]
MWRQVVLYFRTHSYRADNCQAKENLQNEDEADIKAAQWIFKMLDNAPGNQLNLVFNVTNTEFSLHMAPACNILIDTVL